MHTPGEGTMSFADFLELMSEVMVQTSRWGNLATKLDGYVGFDTIQEQIRKKSLKRGFEFNLMVVGTFTYCHRSVGSGYLVAVVRLGNSHTHTLLLCWCVLVEWRRLALGNVHVQ